MSHHDAANYIFGFIGIGLGLCIWALAAFLIVALVRGATLDDTK